MGVSDYVQISISLITLLSLVFLIIQIYFNKKEIEYSNFVTTLKYYDKLVEQSQEKWKLIKDVVHKNPKTKSEIPDRQDTLSYLIIRLSQKESFYAVEEELLDQEIRSLNFLNELCKVAKNERKSLLTLTYSSDISYYQNRKDDLLSLYNEEKHKRKYSKPIFEYIDKF